MRRWIDSSRRPGCGAAGAGGDGPGLRELIVARAGVDSRVISGGRGVGGGDKLDHQITAGDGDGDLLGGDLGSVAGDEGSPGDDDEAVVRGAAGVIDHVLNGSK